TRTVADPDVGAKLTGRSQTSTYGVFLAEDAVTALLFPGSLNSSNEVLDQSNRVFVGRYAHSFGENASTLGVLITSRSGDDYSNDVAGIDGRIRVSDRHSVRFQYLASESEYPQEVVSRFNQPSGVFGGDALSVDYDVDSRGRRAEAGIDKSGRGYGACTGCGTPVVHQVRGV